MTDPHPRTSAVSAFGLAGCLLLAACSSGAPAPAARTRAPAAQATAGATSASPAGPTSTAATPAGATSTAANSRGITACSLITEQEAGTALGADPGPGQENTHLGTSSCMYGTSPTIVTVNLLPSGGRVAYDHARERAPAGQLVDVAAVGDGAFGVFRGPAAEIWFYKGDAMIAIGVIVGGTAIPPKDQAILLAKTASDRL